MGSGITELENGEWKTIFARARASSSWFHDEPTRRLVGVHGVGVEKNSAKRSWDFVLICSTDNDRSATVGYGKRGKARGKGWLHRLVEVALARDDGVGFKQIGLHGRNSRSRKLVMCSTQTHDSKLSS